MQSTNCTAYIAPEVGLSVLVNRASAASREYFLAVAFSPHCKAGATLSPSSLQKKSARSDGNATRTFWPSTSPPILRTYIEPKSPLLSTYSNDLIFYYNPFSYFLHICCLGVLWSVQWICSNVLLACSYLYTITLPPSTSPRQPVVLDAQTFNQSRSLHPH